MRTTLRPAAFAVAVLASGGWLPAQAIGIGPAQVGSHLGHPLSVDVLVHGLDTDSSPPGCIKADVGSIEGSVFLRGRAQLTTTGNAGRIQVRTRQVINEPIIALLLSVGCEAPVQREYQILLDLPGSPGSPELAVSNTPAVPALLKAVAAKEITTGLAAHQQAPKKRSQSPRASSSRVAAAQSPDVYTPPAFPPFGLRLSMTLTMPSAGMEIRTPVPAVPAAKESQVAKEAQQAQIQPAPTPAPVAVTLTAQKTASPHLTLASTVQAPSLSASVNQELRQSNRSLESLIQGMAAALIATLGAMIWTHSRMKKEHAALSTELEAVTEVRKEAVEEAALSASLANGRLHASVEGKPASRSAAGAGVRAAPAEDMHGKTSEAEWIASVAGSGTTAPATSANEYNDGQISAEEVSDLIELAEAWLSLNRPEAVIEILRPMVKVETPKSPLPWLYLMNAYRLTGDRKSFDLLFARIKDTFNIDVPAWGEQSTVTADSTKGLASFPHIRERILATWHSEGIVSYLESLLPDDRGDRQGFPPAVLEDILTLIHIAGDPRLAEGKDGGVPEEVLKILRREEVCGVATAASGKLAVPQADHSGAHEAEKGNVPPFLNDIRFSGRYT